MNSLAPSITARQHLYFWTATFLLFLAFVWVFSDILLPFVLGLAIAYLLEPLVTFLGNRKIPRTIAVLGILGTFIVFVLVIFALILPPLYRESLQLADAMPGYIDQLWSMAEPYAAWMQDRLGGGDMEALKNTLRDNAGKAVSMGAGLLSNLLTGGQAIAGFVSLMVLTPIVSFFMMREWKNMTNWIDKLIPRSRYDTIKGLLTQIDTKMSGFVRGQLSVAFFLAIIYAIALSIAGLKFGFLIGLSAGILSIIPLVGSTIGLLVSVVVAWFQSGEWSYVAIIAAIFLVGQFVEGNILTPRLLGKSVGLHPLWILFALLAGGSLFGIVGMLLAVPVAAIIGVLLAFGIDQYKKSPYYDEAKDSGKKAKKSKAEKSS